MMLFLLSEAKRKRERERRDKEKTQKKAVRGHFQK